jgi:hypothetical protein
MRIDLLKVAHGQVANAGGSGDGRIGRWEHCG